MIPHDRRLCPVCAGTLTDGEAIVGFNQGLTADNVSDGLSPFDQHLEDVRDGGWERIVLADTGNEHSTHNTAVLEYVSPACPLIPARSTSTQGCEVVFQLPQCPTTIAAVKRIMAYIEPQREGPRPPGTTAVDWEPCLLPSGFNDEGVTWLGRLTITRPSPQFRDRVAYRDNPHRTHAQVVATIKEVCEEIYRTVDEVVPDPPIPFDHPPSVFYPWAGVYRLVTYEPTWDWPSPPTAPLEPHRAPREGRSVLDVKEQEVSLLPPPGFGRPITSLFAEYFLLLVEDYMRSFPRRFTTLMPLAFFSQAPRRGWSKPLWHMLKHKGLAAERIVVAGRVTEEGADRLLVTMKQWMGLEV
jgi:hypothetical protein